jgi:MarR family 2-MHQ and catechol resistance regulon transcriptional repressor
MKANKKYNKKVDLALNTWIKLARAFATLNKKSTESIKRFGLTQPQFSVIEILGHLGPLKVGEICEKMLVSGGNMTLVLDNIAKLGYVERIHDLNDRRAIQVQLTAKGAELFDKIFTPHAEFISETMSVLSAVEQKELGILLKKLGTTIR